MLTFASSLSKVEHAVKRRRRFIYWRIEFAEDEKWEVNQ